MDDELALADGREAVAVGVADALGGARGERGEEEIGTRVEQQLARVREAEQPLADDEVLRCDPDLVHQEGLEIGRDLPIEGQSDDRAPAPLAEEALELPDEVLGFLLDLHVAVAQHPAHARVLDAESGEEAGDEGSNHLLDGDEAFVLAAESDEPRDPPGDRDEPEHRLLGVADAPDHQAEAEVGDEGERMRGVARDGGEHREDLAHEVLFDIRSVGVFELRLVEHDDPIAPQLGHQSLPAVLLAVHQRPGTDRDRRELLRRGHAVLARDRDAGLHLAVQPGDPHHVELVEVGRGDGEEPHPFEQGHARIPGFLEHPLVEREPGDLAVDEAFGRVGSDCRKGSGHGAAPGAARRKGRWLQRWRSLLRLRENLALPAKAVPGKE